MVDVNWRTLVAIAAIGLAAFPASAKVSYRCEDGSRLTADFLGSSGTDGRVVLVFRDARGSLTLAQTLSADGGRYADDKTEFWIKGRSATLTRDGKSTTCSTRGSTRGK